MTEINTNIEGVLGQDLSYDDLQTAIKEFCNDAGIVEFRVTQIVPLSDSVQVSIQVDAYTEKPLAAKAKGKPKGKPKEEPAKDEPENQIFG
jgi:hypothetical protein